MQIYALLAAFLALLDQGSFDCLEVINFFRFQP